ncbi:MAG: CRISPR-associated protein Csx3, partial [Chloroflexi bacterium]|nr:CRISPR-associated protein Csx3 [Chloroflexota bacterium]
LPLLVDVGGRPKEWQEVVFANCTHAILLVADQAAEPGAFERDMTEWQAMMFRNGVPIIAQIQSRLDSSQTLKSEHPLIVGSISGLVRGQLAAGPTFDAIAERLSRLFFYSEAELTQRHLDQAPAELALDLQALAQTLGLTGGRWEPSFLPSLCDYLPVQKPLAAYGRAPNWVYATLALQAHPADFWLFDARLGWVQPPILPLYRRQPTGRSIQPGWQVKRQVQGHTALLTMQTESQYLDIDASTTLPLVKPPVDSGLILSGKVPHWLMTAAARQLAPASRWLAVYQPQLKGAVVVHTKVSEIQVGQVVPVETFLM